MTEDGPKIYDYALLGCGISALVAAKQLSKDSRVLIIEGYPEPGGNHQSFTFQGMEFDIGSIYFNTQDEQFRLFPELLEQCIRKEVEVKKICPNGALGDYPFQWKLEVSPLGLKTQLSCILSLIRGRLLLDKHESSSSYARSRIGDELYRRAGLDIYIRRLFGVEGELIDADFGLKRMQWLLRETSLRYRVKRRLKALFRHSATRGQTVVRPTGGFGQYYRNALTGLRESGVDFIFGEIPTRIDCSTLPIEIQTESGPFFAKKVISTVPLDQISRLCGLPPVNLPTVTLLSLFVALRGTWKPHCSVLHNFHSGGNWKRITVHSDFYETEKTYDKHFTVEISVPPGNAVPNIDKAFEELKAHVEALDLIDGRLELIGSAELGNAYPVPMRGFGHHRDLAVDMLASHGVICLGRQGKFEYLPHSNVAAREAAAAFAPGLSGR